MTPAEFQATLKTLGMTARSFARMSGRPETTVANWTSAARVQIPEEVVAWLTRRLRDLARDPPP